MDKEKKSEVWLKFFFGLRMFVFLFGVDTENMHEANALNVAGKSLSISLTSLLKRLINRPIGVTSKKHGRARITFVRKSLCK